MSIYTFDLFKYPKILVICFLFLNFQILKGQDIINSFEGRNVSVELTHNYEKGDTDFLLTAHFTINPEWHIYWKNSGTTGMPTSVSYDLPDGLVLDKTYYSEPKYYSNEGFVDYTYENEAILVSKIKVVDSAFNQNGVKVSADAEWLECKNVCVPGGTTLTLSLSDDYRSSQNIISKSNRVLLKSENPVSGEYGTNGSDIRVKIESEHYSDFSDAYFFSDNAITDASSEQLSRVDLNTWIIDTKPGEDTLSSDTAHGIIVFTKEDGKSDWVSVSLQNNPKIFSTNTASDTDQKKGLGLIILLAYVGGLILNLMPCVFPVIGLKIMGFVEQAGQDSKKVMMHGLVFAAGVIASFWVLSGLLLALRSGGEQLGWGFQLQEPWFNYSLIVLLLAFALSLNGVFEFGISAIGVGSKLQQKSGFSGSFFSGVLATVVATPCSAPFLAPALGAALTLEPFQSLIVFTFIAIGLSTPYLLLSLFPSVLNKMPRPGAWMETFKQFMAFPLYGTVAYLIWSVFGQIDDSNQFNLLLSLVGIALALWVYGRWAVPSKPKKTRVRTTIIALILIVGSIVYGHPKEQKAFWEPWSPELVEKYVAEGRTVYVDFTARWCATCQLNKRVVFSSDEVLDAFKKGDVVALKADWTNRDERITIRLRELGKAAVPVNLVYKGGSSEPVVLPEVLTPKIVLEAL